MKATIAFYKGEGNWIDKVIKWWTKGPYSHVELVIDGEWYSTSPRDLAVRKKVINPKEGNWDYLEVEVDYEKVNSFFNSTKGAKYDWLGILFSEILPLNVDNRKRWYCSEWVSTAIGHKKTNIDPNGLYKMLVK